MSIGAVVLDLGGVLVRWDPAAAVAGLLTPEEWVEAARELDFAGLNAEADAGRPYAELRARVRRDFAGRPDLVRAWEHYHAHVGDSFPGEVPGTSRIVAELADAGVALYGLTNWSAETVENSCRAAPVIARFADVVVSGREGVTKPDPRLFRILLQRHGLEAPRCVFVDDSPVNVDAAAVLGMRALRFVDAAGLRRDLAALGLPVAPTPLAGPPPRRP